MAQRAKLPTTKICLLGTGPLAQPTFEYLRATFPIVELEEADLVVVANYGWILPKTEIARPKYGVINIHPSLLPLYRGPAPIQSALAAGEPEIGLTIIQIDGKVDHGSILVQEKLKVSQQDTTESLMLKAGQLARASVVKHLVDYLKGKLKPRPQNHRQATFTHKLTAPVILNQYPARQQFNLVRAYASEPGTFYQLDGIELKILKAKLVKGKLVPVLVQRPGKKIIPYGQFLTGWRGSQPF